MALVVGNIKGPVLSLLGKQKLIDAILLIPRRYDYQRLKEFKSQKGLSKFPFVFETDFHNSTGNWISRVKMWHDSHLKFARNGDFIILPDVRGDHKVSMARYKAYLSHALSSGLTDRVRFIFPHQAVKPAKELFDLADQHAGIIGIPALFDRGVPRDQKDIELLIDYCLDHGFEYHLLGFNPTRWPLWYFQKAFSFDSQGVFSYLRKYPSEFRVVDGYRWVEIDNRKTSYASLSLELRVLMFFEQLRAWLTFQLPKKGPMDKFLEVIS